MHTLKNAAKPIYLWTAPESVEPEAMRQLQNIASLPWVHHHVAVMPDVHFGKGATVGSVIAMDGAIAPAAVGVDIGCGMTAVRTSLTSADLPDDLRRLRNDLEAAVPVGFESHKVPVAPAHPLFARFDDLDPNVQRFRDKALRQVGTLGGGNHFLEICLDTDQRVWIMLHSGSRGIGNQLAQVHIEKARKLPHNADLPDRDLAVFLTGTPLMGRYRHDLDWAQEYAYLNREKILDIVCDVFRRWFSDVGFGDFVTAHHNYVAEEEHYGRNVLVTRKGAIRAREGDMGIIPGSMGARSFIVRGLGNPKSFTSCSHGAGRRMSRTQARKRISLAELRQQTKGVECRKDAGVLDEAPSAYKDIDEVMANQHDLVEVVAELRQVVCIKG